VGGRRINQVEDVLALGDEIEVRVDDVDPQARSRCRPSRRSAVARGATPVRPGGRGQRRPGRPARADTVSFEDAFDAD